MSDSVPGDPASCSLLGGALRSAAAALAQALADVPPSGWTRDVGSTVETLDRAGALLQVHAQELAEVAAARRRLAERVDAAGLTLRDGRVVEPSGPVPVQVARSRLAAVTELQEHAGRLASRLGRARAGLTRALEQACVDLESVSTRMRADVGATRGQ
ncbi:MAG: hypothetical protein V9F82_04160 [Dermatophilaceae bacterium]